MGAIHSDPASHSSRTFRSSNQFASSVYYRPEVPPARQKKSRSYDVNNNQPLRADDLVNKTITTTNSSRKQHSALSCGWNLAKRTAAAAFPSFLNSNFNGNRSSSDVLTRGLNPRTSEDRELTSELKNCQLDELNQNEVNNRVQFDKIDSEHWRLTPQQPNGSERSQSPRSQDPYSISEEYRKDLDLNEQDLTNNNAVKKWVVVKTPPRRVPRFFNRLMQLGNHEIDSAKYRHKSRSSKPTPSLSCSSSAASTSSESAYSIFSTSTANVTAQDDREEKLSNEMMSVELDARLDCSLRPFPSQHSFISPSESFIESDFNGTTFSSHEIVSSSTAELLQGLGRFVSDNCKVSEFEPAQLVMWLRSIDRSLMIQGWQDVAFVNPANLVFVYLLIRAQLSREYHEIRTVGELQSLVRTCLYLAYSYMGNEISYPLKPFISHNENRSQFWSRCLQLINSHSDEMLRLNSSTEFFLDVFDELRGFAELERC